MKRLKFLGNSHERIKSFPIGARKEAGVQLHKVQLGLEPSDWKPVQSIGSGVGEIRIWDEGGTYRVIYVTQILDIVHVLHAFQERSEQTLKRDIDLAAKRLRQIGLE